MLKLAAHDKSAPAIYRTLAAGAVGYLEYRRCVSGDALERNLHDALTRAQQAKVRALVVDVRRNGGGSNSANDQVLHYLTSKPCSEGNRFAVRASRMVKAKYGFAEYVQRYFAPNAWFAPEGSVVTIAGPMYLLVGPGTFSSAQSFSETVQEYGIATLVGKPLGEPANSNGQIFPVRAPRTCLNASIASKFFYAIKPRPDSDVVTPGRDPVLAAVLERVRRG